MSKRIGLPSMGLGTAPLGGMFTEVGEREAMATVEAALSGGLRYFDTAPLYGHGLSEERLGRALHSASADRSELVISTKVGRVLDPGSDPDSIFYPLPPVQPVFDFSAGGVRRSFEESLERLDLDHIDLVLVHDPDDHEQQAVSTAFPTLRALRDEGLIGAIGSGMNQTGMLSRFVVAADDLGLDCVLVAGRWSLLDRTAAAPGGLFDVCADHDISVIVGGVFNSGLLADPSPGATFDYREAPADLVAAQRMAGVCRDFGVPLTHAALQFPARHPAVTTVLFGARTPAEVESNLAGSRADLPDELWPALDDCLATVDTGSGSA